MKKTGFNEAGSKEYKDDITGIYILKVPFFVVRKPRLTIYRKKGKGKVEGELTWMWFKKKLSLVKHKENQWFFQFNVDIASIDVIINFGIGDIFEGLMDTPVGHVRFTGKKVGRS